jgi:hypothetical protein
MILGNLDGGICFYKGDSLLSSIHLIEETKEIFNVAPNPTSNSTFIRFENKFYAERTIELLDFSGRNLQTIHSNQPVIELRTEDWSDGVYLVRCREKNKTSTKKIVIHHP